MDFFSSGMNSWDLVAMETQSLLWKLLWKMDRLVGWFAQKNGEFDSYVYRRVLSSSLKPAAILAMQLLRPIPEQLSSKVFLAEEAIDLSSTKPQSHIAVATLFSNVWGSWLFYVIFWVSWPTNIHSTSIQHRKSAVQQQLGSKKSLRFEGRRPLFNDIRPLFSGILKANHK